MNINVLSIPRDRKTFIKLHDEILHKICDLQLQYIDIFKQINVEILTFYKLLIIVYTINFEIVF